MLLLRLPRSFALRYAERAFCALLIHEPPRSTRLPPAFATDTHVRMLQARSDHLKRCALQLLAAPSGGISVQGDGERG
jgi:hypothetical protein